MLESVLAIPFWLEFAATISGGISGAMSATRARYDVFGVVCIAIVTGLAGGMLRDILLQDYGIYAFQEPSLIVGCAVCGILVFFLGKLVSYLDPVIDLLDNLSVALWAVIGTGKGLQAGIGVIPAVIMGTITAVGGGIIRDISMGREPEVFHAGTLYGLAAFLGSVLYAVMALTPVLEPYAELVCVIFILALRYASLAFGWRTSPPRDYSAQVIKVAQKPFELWGRFKRFLGIGKQEDPDSTETLRRKIRNYEAFRRVWRAPGKTSPLPSVESLQEKEAAEEAAAEAGDGAAAEAAAEGAAGQEAGKPQAGEAAGEGDAAGGGAADGGSAEPVAVAKPDTSGIDVQADIPGVAAQPTSSAGIHHSHKVRHSAAKTPKNKRPKRGR